MTLLGEEEDETESMERRSRSGAQQLRDTVVTVGSLSGATVAVLGLLGYALDKLPFAKTEDLLHVNQRVDSLYGSMATLQVNQLQSLELQLTSRLQQITEQMNNLSPTDGYLRGSLRQNLNEVQQRLTAVTYQLSILQRGGSQPQ